MIAGRNSVCFVIFMELEIKMDMSQDVVVSVMMIAYNVGKYIDYAIAGVMGQNTDFSMELVIGEDQSTDDTYAKCCAWKERFPGRIRLVRNEHNLGLSRNYQSTWHHCKGKYVAVCDGDDYWTDPRKLQKMVDYMESHPETSLCFHRVLNWYADTGFKYLGERLAESDFTLADLAVKNFITHSSVLERKENLPELPDWTMGTNSGDYLFSLIQATKGKIHYFPEIMGVYVKHSSSFWTGAGGLKEDPVTVRERFIDYLSRTGNDANALSNLKLACDAHYLKWLGVLGMRPVQDESEAAARMRESALSRLRERHPGWSDADISAKASLCGSGFSFKQKVWLAAKKAYGYLTVLRPLPKPAGNLL